MLLGLYGPEHHRVDLSGDVTDVEQPTEQTREDRALSQWTVGRLSEQFFKMNVKKVCSNCYCSTDSTVISVC